VKNKILKKSKIMIKFLNKKSLGFTITSKFGLGRQKQAGFTLIELLVVIAIIGILATIVLVVLSNARSKARDARRETDMHQFSVAMEMYYDSNNSAYWSGAAAPVTLAIGGNTFMATVPTNPSGGSCPNGAGTSCTYVWISNVVASGKYLICAPLEQGGAVYSSQNGTKTLATGTGCPAALE
jgi:prepilin-type N-terminal cleavage/methylation domain-containing protein